MPEAQWQTVATTAELPEGGRKLITVAGKSVGLFNVHGEIIAVLDVCPHELAPVCRGRVSGTTLPSPPGEYEWGRDGEILACPWHGWEFDLTTGRCLVDDKLHLRRYPVQVVGDEVRIAL